MSKYKIKYIAVSIEEETFEAPNKSQAIAQFHAKYIKTENSIYNIIHILDYAAVQAKINEIKKSMEPKPVVVESLPVKKESEVDAALEKIFPKEDEVIYDLIIHPETRSIETKHGSTSLTSREYDLLVYLAHNADRTCPTSEILENVFKWNVDMKSDTKLVSSSASRLRKKLYQINSTTAIDCIRGLGYMLMPEDE